MKIKNLRYIEATNTLINMDVTIDGQTVPFTYHPDDEAPGRADQRGPEHEHHLHRSSLAAEEHPSILEMRR